MLIHLQQSIFAVFWLFNIRHILCISKSLYFIGRNNFNCSFHQKLCQRALQKSFEWGQIPKWIHSFKWKLAKRNYQRMFQNPEQTRNKRWFRWFGLRGGDSIWNNCSWQCSESNDRQISSNYFWNETCLWSPSGNMSGSSKWQESSQAFGVQKIYLQDWYEVIWVPLDNHKLLLNLGIRERI